MPVEARLLARLANERRRAGLIALAAILPFLANPAQAQIVPSPSQVTPKNIAPPAQPAPPVVITAAPAAKAPPGAENLHVTVGTVVVDGGLENMASDTERLVAPFRGKTVSVAQLYTLAGSIEDAYAQEGYILVRIVVPQQTLRDGGEFHLKLIDGFIESLDLSHVPEQVAGPLGARLERLVGVRHPRLSEIERALTLAATVPGVTLKSTLAAGKEPGGARLIIEAEYAPFSGQIAADNKLGREFGDWELNLQASANSLMGMGEQVYAYLSGDPAFWRAFDADAPRRVAGGGISIPLGSDGLSATAEGTIADTQPVVPGAFFKTDGLFKRLDAKLSYPLIKSRAESLILGGAFEYSVETETASAFHALLDEDRLNVLRASVDWNRSLGEDGNLEVFGQLSKGVTWINVRTISDVGATGIGFSRVGVTPNFFKTELRIAYSRGDLPYGLSLSAELRGQFAFNQALPSSELFSLDGDDAVSILTSGAISGDSGLTGRFELGRRIAWEDFVCTPYLFTAAGEVSNKISVPGVPYSAWAYGGGVRIAHAQVLGLTPQLSVEAGHVDAGIASASRVMVSLGVSL
jgi:hemolysin activation/secretion protein